MSDADELTQVAKNLRSGKVGPRCTPGGLLAVHDRVLAAARDIPVDEVRQERRESGVQPTVEELIQVIAQLLRIWAREDNTPMVLSGGSDAPETRYSRPAPRRAAIAVVVREAFKEGIL